MNRQYLEYILEIGIPAASSHHGQQQSLHQQPGCKAANPSDHHDVEACSPLADHVGDSNKPHTFEPVIREYKGNCLPAREPNCSATYHSCSVDGVTPRTCPIARSTYRSFSPTGAK